MNIRPFIIYLFTFVLFTNYFEVCGSYLGKNQIVKKTLVIVGTAGLSLGGKYFYDRYLCPKNGSEGIKDLKNEFLLLKKANSKLEEKLEKQQEDIINLTKISHVQNKDINDQSEKFHKLQVSFRKVKKKIKKISKSKDKEGKENSNSSIRKKGKKKKSPGNILFKRNDTMKDSLTKDLLKKLNIKIEENMDKKERMDSLCLSESDDSDDDLTIVKKIDEKIIVN